MKTQRSPVSVSRQSLKLRIRRLLRGKFKDSSAPCTAVARELRETLNASGIPECDHKLAVMNMAPRNFPPVVLKGERP